MDKISANFIEKISSKPKKKNSFAMLMELLCLYASTLIYFIFLGMGKGIQEGI